MVPHQFVPQWPGGREREVRRVDPLLHSGKPGDDASMFDTETPTPTMTRITPPEQRESQAPSARDVRVEVACARTLLDELEAVLDGKDDGRARHEVVAQVADQLTRIALAIQGRSRETRPPPSPNR